MLPAPTFERSDEFAQRADSAVWAGRLFFFCGEVFLCRFHLFTDIKSLRSSVSSYISVGNWCFFVHFIQVVKSTGITGPVVPFHYLFHFLQGRGAVRFS